MLSFPSALPAALALLCGVARGEEKPGAPPPAMTVAMAQVPGWSRADLDFFLHGSMSTEFAPEAVLRAFIRIYPDVFPTADLSHLGLLPDAAFGWPVGFSRRNVPHLGGLPAVGRNLLAALGLGAPLDGHRGQLDFALLQRHTALTEQIRAPHYPFAIDDAAAKRGAAHYTARCASCHDGPETDKRLHPPSGIGTDPRRATAFTPAQADRFNTFLAALEIPGYTAASEPGIGGTQKYWSAALASVWARSPYLHNGSVRTMQELLTPPAARAKTFHRGSQIFDAAQLGYTDADPYVVDTAAEGSSNAGHDYGTDLPAGSKRELIEYLKTL